MRTKRRWLLAMLVLLAPLLFLVKAKSDQEDAKLQWVIASVGPALAQDNSKIVLTGSGTFEPAESHEVTGGGTWKTFNPVGVETGSGTYRVTGLVRFDLAPGSVANPAIRAGLAFLNIKYSDGSRGILAVSCHLIGTPDSVAEGIIASKGFTLYWNHIQAGSFFRVIPEDED